MTHDMNAYNLHITLAEKYSADSCDIAALDIRTCVSSNSIFQYTASAVLLYMHRYCTVQRKVFIIRSSTTYAQSIVSLQFTHRHRIYTIRIYRIYGIYKITGFKAFILLSETAINMSYKYNHITFCRSLHC